MLTTIDAGWKCSGGEGLQEVAEGAGCGEAGSVGAYGAGGGAVADQVDAGVEDGGGAVHADAAGGFAEVEGRRTDAPVDAVLGVKR